MRKKNKIDRICYINNKQYKLILLKDKTSQNLHHVLSQKNKEYNVDSKENKKVVSEIWHDNLNRFFGNRQMPHLQLKYMLEDRWRDQVLSEWVVKELYALLSLPRELFYKESLVKDKYKWKSLFNDEKILKDFIS